ncbi:MAG: nucleoside-diphosphate-sugar epimerase [Alteromonadaceae bacterium]|jgi:nucleoside-diphosphate-sugar epimerase
MKVLLTGASGFVGSSLLKMLINKKQKVSVVVRNHLQINSSIEQIQVNEINSKTNWSEITGYSIVIHCAGSAHGKGLDTLEHFREINTNGTLHLAKEAFKKGMQRFIFISSIGVNGSKTNKPFTEDSVPSPCSDYARSKHEAERGLTKLATELGFELVIIRPPLVYGASAPGNFGKLVKMVSKVPLLPFALSKNARSFISVNNLSDFIYQCAINPKAAGELFLISDGKDLSIKELTNLIANGLGEKRYQIPLPLNALKWVAKILGKEQLASQLLDDLQIDSSKSFQVLGWIPPEETSMAFKKIRE